MDENDADRINSIESRLDQVQSTVDDQQEIIEDQREIIASQRDYIAELESDNTDEDETTPTRPVSRRDALKAGGLVGLLGLSAGTASADSQGLIGTNSDPLQTLFTEELILSAVTA